MLGDVCLFQALLADAKKAYSHATEVPESVLEGLCGLAEVALARGDRVDYQRYVEATFATPAISPEARARRSFLRLRAGDILGGFADRQAMWQYASPENSSFRNGLNAIPWWDGSPLRDGDRLIVHSEDGLGDGLQFVRFVPEVLARARSHVTLVVAKSLVRLFQANLQRPVEVISASEGCPTGATAQVPLLAVPHLLGVSAASLRSTPYLVAPSCSPRLPKAPSGTRLKIGVAWTGNPENLNNNRRSCDVLDLGPLMQLRDVTFYALQCGPCAVEAEGTSLIRLDHIITDFADTAALIEQLDAVVTVCSSPAHLAGALGIPTFVMVHTESNWRWGLDEHTPWYNCIQVVRQRSPGDWGPVVEKVAAEISKW